MIQPDQIKQSLFTLLTETFESSNNPGGTVYLDRNAGLFTTIDPLSPEQASQEVFPGSTTVAAQVHHLLFYLEVLERFMHGNRERANWAESWEVRTVDEEAWDDLKVRLKTTYHRLREFLQLQENWDERLEAGYDMVVHTAYHLGAVRQMIPLLNSASRHS